MSIVRIGGRDNPTHKRHQTDITVNNLSAELFYFQAWLIFLASMILPFQFEDSLKLGAKAEKNYSSASENIVIWSFVSTKIIPKATTKSVGVLKLIIKKYIIVLGAKIYSLFNAFGHANVKRKLCWILNLNFLHFWHDQKSLSWHV